MNTLGFRNVVPRLFIQEYVLLGNVKVINMVRWIAEVWKAY